MPTFRLEQAILKSNPVAVIAGIDEAGRGPWAGPVVAAAAILNHETLPQHLSRELNDSKKLSAIVLGFKISKSQRLTNWDAEILTEQQLIYGATDAWVSCDIYKKLLISPKAPIIPKEENTENSEE